MPKNIEEELIIPQEAVLNFSPRFLITSSKDLLEMKKANKKHRALKASEKIEFVKSNDKLLPAEYFEAKPDPSCKCTVSHFFIRNNMESHVKRAI